MPHARAQCHTRRQHRDRALPCRQRARCDRCRTAAPSEPDVEPVRAPGIAAMLRRHPHAVRRSAVGAIAGGTVLFVVASLLTPGAGRAGPAPARGPPVADQPTHVLLAMSDADALPAIARRPLHAVRRSTACARARPRPDDQQPRRQRHPDRRAQRLPRRGRPDGAAPIRAAASTGRCWPGSAASSPITAASPARCCTRTARRRRRSSARR